jgi:predicted phage tail protein
MTNLLGGSPLARVVLGAALVAAGLAAHAIAMAVIGGALALWGVASLATPRRHDRR